MDMLQSGDELAHDPQGFVRQLGRTIAHVECTAVLLVYPLLQVSAQSQTVNQDHVSLLSPRLERGQEKGFHLHDVRMLPQALRTKQTLNLGSESQEPTLQKIDHHPQSRVQGTQTLVGFL